MELLEGVVVNSHPNTYTADVVIDGDGDTYADFLVENVPMMSPSVDPHMRGGTVSLPKAGTVVILALVGKNYVILGCLPQYTNRTATSGPVSSVVSSSINSVLSILGHDTSGKEYGGDDPVHKNTGGRSFRMGMPSEVMPGDWAHYGSDGNMVGVLEGGVNIFKASDTAQIQAYKMNDTVKVVAKRFQVMSDFGMMEFTSDVGKTGFSIRGSQSAASSAPTVEQFNLEFTLGKAGTPYVKLGTDKTYIEIKEGRIYHKGDLVKIPDRAGGDKGVPLNIYAGEDKRIEGASKKIVDGQYVKSIGGDELRAVQGGSTTKIDGDYSRDTKNAEVTANGTYSITATGWGSPVADGPFVPTLQTGMDLKSINGNMRISSGDYVVPGVVPGPQSLLLKPSLFLEANSGDVQVSAVGQGAVTINAVTPPSPSLRGGPTYGIVLNSPQILLGGLPVPNTPHPAPGVHVPSPMGVVKDVPLQAWMTAITNAISAHMHPSTSGVTSPDLALAASLNSALGPALASIGSKTVFILPAP